jgi:HlyD family secretion protein
MNAPHDVQAQLRSLSIPKEQRPRAGLPARGFKGLIVAVMIVGLAAVGVYVLRPDLGARLGAAVGGASEAAAVRLMQVTVGREPPAQAALTATGKIVSDHRVAVSTKVSGQIVALYFEQGDRVGKEQLLARIEDVLYRARRDEAAARLEQSAAHLTFQKVNFERVAGLVKSESAPDIEYADAKRALEEAEAAVAADRATLDFTQKTLTDCEVVAPIAGVVLTRNVEVGDFVAAEGGRGANANAQFAIIADMTQLRVEVDISELDILRIRKDMPCTIIPDAYKDRQYRGFVMWLDPGANYSKATVQVKVRIENPDDYLRVEGSAQVAFLSEPPQTEPQSTATAIWIPSSACLVDASGKTGIVFLAENERLRRTTIHLGRRHADQLEVTGGLTAGQSIAVDGLNKLTDGQSVTR